MFHSVNPLSRQNWVKEIIRTFPQEALSVELKKVLEKEIVLIGIMRIMNIYVYNFLYECFLVQMFCSPVLKRRFVFLLTFNFLYCLIVGVQSVGKENI